MSVSAGQDDASQSAETLSAWREEINAYIAALESNSPEIEDWKPRYIAYLLKKGGPAFRGLRARVEALEAPLLEAKRDAEQRAAHIEAERKMVKLALEAKQYFEQNPMHLTGARVAHEAWMYPVPVEYTHRHGSFGKRNAEIWHGRMDYCRESYVGQGHPLIVDVDRRPGAIHLRRHVEIRNNLLMRSYQPGSWSDEPVTLVRAQGGLEGWQEAEQFLYESGDAKERARKALFETWRHNPSFLSTRNSSGPLGYKATVYLIYQVEAKCPLMDAYHAGEYVIPPGVEMRAKRVEIQKDYSAADGRDRYYYVIEVDVRKSKTYIPLELPLPDVYDRCDEMETEEAMERLGWHAQPIAKRKKANQ